MVSAKPFIIDEIWKNSALRIKKLQYQGDKIFSLKLQKPHLSTHLVSHVFCDEAMHFSIPQIQIKIKPLK